MGALGESLAAEFLRRHGLFITGRNVKVGSGEVDILALDHSKRLVVEVRTTSGSNHPLDSVGDSKRRQVRRLAGLLQIRRIDLIGVGVFDDHLVIHWDPNSF